MRGSQLATCSALVLSLLAPTGASADQESRSNWERELARLEQTLRLSSTEARSGRLVTALTQGVLGAATLTPGLILVNRSDEVRHFVGTGLIVGGSAQLATAPLMLIPTSVERIYGQLMERTARGEDAQSLVQSIEVQLREAAARKRSARFIIGGVDLGVGIASLVTGMVFLLGNDGMAGMSRQGQLNLAATLVGIGGPFTTGGMRFLLQKSPEELAWESYSSARPGESSSETSASKLSFFAAPCNGGAFGTVQGAF